MSAFGDTRADMAGKLGAAGVPATLDPRAVPPFVLVGAPTVVGGRGVGAWATEVPVWIVGPHPAAADTLAWQLDQLELVLRTLGPAGALPLTYGERELPAYLVTYPVDVTNPDC